MGLAVRLEARGSGFLRWLFGGLRVHQSISPGARRYRLHAMQIGVCWVAGQVIVVANILGNVDGAVPQ